MESLREAEYHVTTVDEASYPGLRNDELAALSIRLGMIILTRDADFTRLRQPLMRRIKVVYIRLKGGPDRIARHLLNHIEECIRILQDHHIVMLDGEGPHIY